MGIQKVIKPSIKTRLLIKFISIGESGMADSFCGFGRAHHCVSINRTPVFCGKTTQFGERLSRWKLTEMMSAELLYLRKSNHFALNQKDASRIYIEAFTSTLFYVYNVYMGENTSINTLRMINFTIFS